jgi:hypothetical protein
MEKHNLDDLAENGAKGDWCFLENDTCIAIRYGVDAFKEVVVIPISTVPLRNVSCWTWNGSKDCPTLTPSILVKAYEGWTLGWHGFLTDGKLITV